MLLIANCQICTFTIPLCQVRLSPISGPPPPPLLITAAVDHQAVAFSILPQLEGLRCVLNYTITATSRVGNVLPPIVVEATGNGEPITHIEAGFDLCNNTYTFYATANTLTYIGHRSMEVSPAFACKNYTTAF